jgi:hypothetical protein
MSKAKPDLSTAHARALRGASEYRYRKIRAPKGTAAKEPAPEVNPVRWTSRLEQAQRPRG